MEIKPVAAGVAHADAVGAGAGAGDGTGAGGGTGAGVGADVGAGGELEDDPPPHAPKVNATKLGNTNGAIFLKALEASVPFINYFSKIDE